LGGEWGRSRDWCIRWSGDRRREWALLGVNLERIIVINGEGDALSKLLWGAIVLFSELLKTFFIFRVSEHFSATN